MGVRPWLVLLQGEFSAFLLYCWRSPVLSAPSVRVANSQVSSPEAAPELRILLIMEEVDGGGHGWGSKDPRLGRVLPSPWLAGAGTRDKGCSGLIPWASLNNDTLSMVVQASSRSIPLETSSLTPVPSGCILTANRSPLPGSALQIPHFGTQPLSALLDMPLRLGGQGWGQHPVCRSHCVLLPHTVCHVLFPQRMRLSFCPN